MMHLNLHTKPSSVRWLKKRLHTKSNVEQRPRLQRKDIRVQLLQVLSPR